MIRTRSKIDFHTDFSTDPARISRKLFELQYLSSTWHTLSCNRNEYRRSISIEAITLLFIEQRKELKKVFSMIILRIHKNFSNHNLSRIVEGDRSSVSQRQEDTLERWRKGGMEKWRESFVWPSFKKL